MTASLEKLKSDFLEMKTTVDALVSDLDKIKDQIFNHPDVKPKIKKDGQITIDGITIINGQERKWDNSQLAVLAISTPPDMFPFAREVIYKEDRKGTRYIEQNEPELWNKIKPALTTKPKKTQIKVKLDG